MIFSLGIFRDYLYHDAIQLQPLSPLLLTPPFQLFAYALLAVGNVLVLSSMWALGVTGTYLGDYFGILMDEMVEGFPFNVTSAPMYYGSTLSFLGTAVLYARPAGLLLTVEVLVVYLLALRFEEYVPPCPSFSLSSLFLSSTLSFAWHQLPLVPWGQRINTELTLRLQSFYRINLCKEGGGA
jgi:hypothetical protein